MEMNSHQFDEPEGGLKISRGQKMSPEEKDKSPKAKESPQKQNRLTHRGWVFQKQFRKTHRERIN